MTEYCGNSSPATVNYSFNGIAQTKFITQQTPITVETSEVEELDNNPASICWRFTGIGVANNDNYQLFAYGVNPSFHDSGTGMQPYMDGERLQYEGYFYRKGSESVAPTGNASYITGWDNKGDCNPRMIKKCKLTIKSNGATIFEKTGKCPLEYQVTCGDECPEGSHKCTHKAYPGYCCVPCKEVAQRINNIANKVR
ncbi:hypothetical protein [Nostoc sp. 2RC]|uniref:hypothetical protein n=1 Tax=Nostoc sp. 2RC TaxID=2485484 RepID=UPI0016261641|nr:hypothetical protein [Nostoc sp. 2RC]MBC1242069.1 hypothetical protein [Nostoc sp. 2RC]